jgi:predicted acylesterase/phospholipase RssA
VRSLYNTWRDVVADKGDGQGNGVYRIRGNPADYLDPRLHGSPLAQVQRLIADTTSLGRAAAPRLAQFVWPEGSLLERLEGLVDISAFLNVEPFYHLVESCVDPPAIRKSSKTLRVIATGWANGDAQDFNFPRMTDEETWLALEASAAIPGLFPPVSLWGETFIDGGVVQNTPILPAIQEGAVEIHVISLNPKLMDPPANHLDNTLDTFSRVYSAMLASNVSEDVESARWVNEGIEVLERVEESEDVNSDTLRRLVRVAGVIARKLRADGKLPRKLTIHRYYPDKALGGSVLGMLDFSSHAIHSMIDAGYADTCLHDCRVNGCVVPAVTRRETTEMASATAAS